MQVKEIAELTGTTVRTIRYYHQVGLLTVPPVRDGRRDYDVSHLARVGRVRWLADSGLPLAQISAALSVPRDPTHGDQRDAVLTDLRATLDLLGERIASLTAQRDRLVNMVATVEGGKTLSPMPPRVVAFYDALAEGATDDITRAGVRRERDFLELAYLRGDVPPEAELLFAALDDGALTTSLDAFSASLTPELSDEDVERIAAANVARMRDRFGARLPEVARAIDIPAVRRLYDLFWATGRDRERRLGQAVLTKLLATIEEARGNDSR